MSEGVMSEDVIDRDAVLRAAVDEHRRQLEALATGMARVEQIEEDLARLQEQRVEAMREVEQLHADLTSGPFGRRGDSRAGAERFVAGRSGCQTRAALGEAWRRAG
jgi:hypothetical protein